MARDKQRGRLYRAETQGWNSYFDARAAAGTVEMSVRPDNGRQSPRRWFKDLEEVKVYIEDVFKKAPIKRRYPKSVKAGAPRLKKGRSDSHAYAMGGWLISLPNWAMNEIDVLHELAHIINVNDFSYSDREDGGHDWRFARIHLDLIQFVVGRDAEKAMRESYRKHRVKFYPKKKVKPLTEEQKEVLRERIRLVAQGVRGIKKAA